MTHKIFSSKNPIFIILLFSTLIILAACAGPGTPMPEAVVETVVVEKEVEVVKEVVVTVEVKKEVVVTQQVMASPTPLPAVPTNTPVAAYPATTTPTSTPTPLPTPSPAPTNDLVPPPSPSPTYAPVADATPTPPPQSPTDTRPQTEPLRAGSTDDNARWDDYLLYRRNYQGPAVHDLDVSERYLIEVQDAQGYPVMDATVRIFLNGQGQGQEVYAARTCANGQMLFHPLALGLPPEQGDSFLVVVTKDNAVAKFTMPRIYAQGNAFTDHWTPKLDLQQHFEALNLDVLFLLDSTGSMADEIDAIQTTIFDVAACIDQLPGQTNVRYGLVAYRDRGDVYVNQTFDFVPNVADFSRQLNTITANGGGDYPESLNEGLYHALHRVQWGGQNTVRLIFLIADAPPHLDYVQDYDYAVEIDQAARQAIKIFPIASSGLDDQGEYIFRQLAQFTQGRFIFLTYEGPTNSGPPGEVTTHHVDSYTVSNLDDLLVRLVTEELAYQSPVLAQEK